MNNLQRDLNLIKQSHPVIHNITNFVVMNNTANALLAIGASPIMAHAVEEMDEIVSISSALVINIGTLDVQLIEAMKKACEKANELGIPIVLDPVGAGASRLRTDTAKMLIEIYHPQVIRGNASEIKALCNNIVQSKGVDSADSTDSVLIDAMQLAKSTGAIISISGEVDYITDGTTTNVVKGGSSMMPLVTGLGCTATAITATFLAVNKNYLEAATNAMQLMSEAGQRAEEWSRGSGSFQMNFIDALYQISNN